MIACVESNFILEIALGQEQSEQAEAILALAEAGTIELSIPSFALSEPFSTITQRTRRRRSVYLSATDEIRELGRSTFHGRIVTSMSSAVADLLTAADTERLRLSNTVMRILRVAVVTAMDAAIFDEAEQFRSRFGLDIEDAIVLASTVRAMHERPSDERKCFISRNWSDFDEAGIKAELANVGTTFLPNFRRGLEFCQPRRTESH